MHPAIETALLKLEKLNPDSFEVFFKKRSALEIDSRDQKIDTFESAEDIALSIRVIKNRRLGFSFTTSMNPSDIEKSAERAVEIAQVMPEDPYLEFFSFGTVAYPSVDQWDSKGLAVSPKEKAQLALKLEALCREADPRIVAVRGSAVSEIVTQMTLVDSNRETIQHQSTLYTASLTCKAEKDGDSQMGDDFGYANFMDGLAIESVAQTAAQRATLLLGASSIETMQCPVILQNHVVAELIDFISASFSAEALDKKQSLLLGKHGVKICSERVTLIDDGLLSGGYGTSPFDAEGVPSQKNTLIDGGIFKTILSNLYYAKKMDLKATGSSVRSIKSPPVISHSNLILKKGRKSRDTLIKSTHRGVLITELMGLHTANPITGDFSLGASGVMIENGVLSRPVHGFSVAGNILEIFRRITEVASDSRAFGSITCPSVAVSELSIGGAAAAH